MAVSDTEREGVTALYDTTTGQAFGPVFKDEDEVEDFMTWVKHKHNDESIDVRTLNTDQLVKLKDEFTKDFTEWGNLERDDERPFADWLASRA